MNYLNMPETMIYKEVLSEMNLSKKTKSFWDYLFENHLVQPYIVRENASKGSKNILIVLIHQLKMAKNEGVELNQICVKDILKSSVGEENIESIINELTSLLPASLIKEFVSNHWYNIDYDLAKKLLDRFTINELYEMKIIHEQLIIENLEQFDKNLVREKYGERLSIGFIEEYILPYIEPLNIKDTDVNRRDNIGVAESYFYENSGCCVEEMHLNGVSVYVPYGIWVDLFNSIDMSLRCMSNQKYELNKVLKELGKKEQSTEVEVVKRNILSQIEDLKKCELMLGGFAELKHEV